MTSPLSNPIGHYVLPLAHSNELVMNGLLAAAGSGLCYEQSVDSSIVSATWSHYSFVLRGLQTALSSKIPAKLDESLHFLLVIFNLCMVEVGLLSVLHTCN